VKPVTQTITTTNGGKAEQTGDESTTGNCWAACIASIMELDIDEVPNFAAYEDWWQRSIAWVVDRGWYMTFVVPEVVTYLLPGGHHDMPLCIATGKSPRGDFNHSVVWEWFDVKHDPHPSRAGLAGPVLEYALLFKMES
jgi:hypothetical protein